MADKKISQLTGATTPLAGTEVLPIVQGGNTVKVSAADVTAGRAVSAASLALTGSPLAATSGGTGQSSAFTANAVVYAASTSALATGSTFVFNGTNAGINVSPGAGQGRIQLNGGGQSWFKFYDSSAGWNFGTFYKADGTTALGYLGAGGGSAIAGGTVDDLVVRAEGNLIFASNGGTDRGRWDTSGNFKIENGNVVVGTAAKGIDFSANTHAAGMTSELLNWYEEGTWTPNQGSGLSVTGTFSSTGRYTRIGRQVTVIGSLNATTSISCAAGAIITSNLPFAVQGEIPLGIITNASATVLDGISGNPTTTTVYALEAQGATTILYFQMTYFV